jgi:hypothetical protein
MRRGRKWRKGKWKWGKGKSGKKGKRKKGKKCRRWESDPGLADFDRERS